MTKIIMKIAGPKGAILHVNRAMIAKNVKDGGDRPTYTLKLNGPNDKPIYCRSCDWDGVTKCVQTDSPLKCGARAWIEIEAGTWIVIHDATLFADIKQ